MKPKEGDRAFPAYETIMPGGMVQAGVYLKQSGMSLRAYFAARVLEGLLAGRGEHYNPYCDESITNLSKLSVKYADAMIAALGTKE